MAGLRLGALEGGVWHKARSQPPDCPLATFLKDEHYPRSKPPPRPLWRAAPGPAQTCTPPRALIVLSMPHCSRNASGLRLGGAASGSVAKYSAVSKPKARRGRGGPDRRNATRWTPDSNDTGGGGGGGGGAGVLSK